MKTKSDEEERVRERQLQRQRSTDNRGRMQRAVLEGVPFEGDTKLDGISRSLGKSAQDGVSVCMNVFKV